MRTELLLESLLVEWWRLDRALEIEMSCLKNAVNHLGPMGSLPNLQRYRTSSQRAFLKNLELLGERQPPTSDAAKDEAEGDAAAPKPEIPLQAPKPTSRLTVMAAEESVPEQVRNPRMVRRAARARLLRVKGKNRLKVIPLPAQPLPEGSTMALTMVTNMLLLHMLEVFEFLDANGRSPYGEWFDGLNAQAAAKVAVSVTRIGQGNFSNVKGVGGGVHEYRLDFGPGYRIYFGKDGDLLVILLGGGTKKRQQRDIKDAIARWQDYKKRKAQGD